MNYRSKTMAMLLCFFLGCTGAHWYYLGRPRWGNLYLGVLLGSWPVALIAGMIFSDWTPALSACAFLLAWLAELLLAVVVLYDFCCLLSQEPRRFDLEYNR